MPFEEQKATEAAAFLLRLRGGCMSYLKLIKLLYLADRESLARWGKTLTGDRHVSMPHGPVVSNTYNLMIDDSEKPYWSKYISAPMGSYELMLTDPSCPTDRLSRAEERLLAEIFETYGQMTRWQLRDFSHTLPEWRDPQGSATAIALEDILRAKEVPEPEVAEIMSDLRDYEYAQSVLGHAG